ncbi:transferrin-binding protein-like solute binding protein [Psychrobacter celer]|uniref:transferrin-binding protein-like solute binding protein n=1 Tax=Psychrobacter celer TaxID=306572 RepID=UPI0018683CB3|nr:transferrin-binding protein-like solute binding protein [Psychrobacter celer]
MSLNRHSISAVATAKKLKTPLKASVVILTTVILASCASDGGDSTTPKPSPTIPKDDSGTAGGSEAEGSGVDTGSDAQAEAAIKAAEAKTKAAEDALKQAKAKTKAAEDALKAAEMKFGVESQKAAEASQKAIDAARSEAAKAKAAAEAARVEAVAKIEAAAQEAESKIKAAKEAAAKEAVAKVKVAEANAKAAEARANTAEAKAKELQDLLASETAAKEAAEAEKKTAEAETKKAQDKVKTAEEKAAAAIKAVAAAKAEADKKIAALKEATASQVAVAEKEATAAKEALKTAEAQAIVAAKAAAKAAADAAAAAAKEAAAKLEAVKSASEKEITAAKKAAADAQARADKAVKDAADAQKRVEEAEAIAKSEADRADLEALRKEQAIKQAEEAKAEALTAKDEAVKANKEAADSKQLAEKAKADLETAEAALAKAEKDLAEALASGGNPEALQAEVDRRQAALDTANAKAAAAQQAQADAQAAAEAQIAAAQQAAQDAKDALAASQIKNAPEVAKSGVQSLNINVTPLSKVYNTTTRDFEATDNSIVARADIASESEPGAGDGLLGKLSITTSGEGDKDVAGSNGFKAHDDNAAVSALGQELPLTYVSTYKDFEDDMRIGHIDGKAVFSGAELPVNGVAVVGNATQAESMPTEGSVGYTGDATYRQLGIDNDIEFGKSVFTADFVAKNLKGNLAFDKAGKIGLTAAIDGNQFSGTAADNAGYNTEGGFFGGDAQYLGGVYEGNGAQGTYGAKSDLQTAAEQAAIKAQADADAANAAIAGVQAQAAAAKAAADKAQADAAKAQEALAKAEENLANAGNGEDLLAAALERAAAAEAAEAAALDAATKATAAKDVKAQQAADKAIGDAKAEANQKVAEANQQAADAKAQAADAQTRADAAEAAEAKAKAEAITAKEQAETAIAAANAKADQANQQASAAQALAQAEKQKAETAQAEADQAKSELVTAQQKLAEAEQALADALASGGGNTEALQAEVDRRQAALDAANAKAAAAQQAQADAQAAAEAQIAAAQQATQAAADALAASQIKNAPETAKSGVQHISIDATGLNQGMLTTTTRDFGITDETQVQARADIASRGLVSDPVALQVSGDNDTAVAGSSGFNSFENTTKVVTATLGEQDLVYTSTYKDFSDDLRVAHIDGAAAGLLPVNGVAVVGNATQAENMPTEGKVGYTGDATYRETGLDKNIQFGTSVFTADFVAKNLKGDLDFGDKKIGLEATIAGNQFSGSKEGYKADGGFFGGDAQYLGGAQQAADKAIGDAKAEANQKVAEANQQAADAKAQAADAQTRADEAETAKLDAEARAKVAEDALEAAQQLPPAPTNPKAPVNATITGFQNSIADHDNSGISANTSASYDTYTALLNETGSRDFKNSINVELRNASDEDYEGSFKKSELKQIGDIFNNKLNYTSTYKNFDEQMQIGHVYGDLKGLANVIRLSKLSNVYVQGNSTNIDDMQYMKELSQYNIDNGINDGKVDYNGVASYIGNSKSEIIGKDPIIGTSEFKVDFVDSQVDGTLSFDGSSVSQKKIKAEITGNTFAGNWNGVDTKGGFFGEDAKLLGGVYQVSGGKGTYGATKVDPSAEPVPEPKAVTGVMSNTISSVAGTGTDDAIGYRQFVTDNQTFTTTTGEGEETTPNIVEDSAVDNLPSYDKFAARLDIVKPNKFKQPAMITTVRNNDVAFDADSGFMKSKDKNSVTFKNVGSVIGDIELIYDYDSVYKSFGTQMQIGHVYGDLRKEGFAGGVKSRYANVYAIGHATENMPTDGNVQYAGVATYMDNLHLGSGAIKDPVVNGTSTFNVDFVNDSMTGELTFAGINKNIGISANITGNTFAGSKDNIATSGGFYGDGAKFLGGIYQEAQPGNVAGTGTTPGTGTTFQGTFGAEKQ